MLIMKITKNNNLKNGITKHKYLKDINAKSKKYERQQFEQ